MQGKVQVRPVPAGRLYDSGANETLLLSGATDLRFQTPAQVGG